MSKEIEHTNKLIVEFLGGKQVDTERIAGHNYDMFDLPSSFPIKLSEPDMFGMKRTGYLAFHSSWDWQIPVWSKACKLSQQMAMGEENTTRHNKLCDKYEMAVFQDKPDMGQIIIVQFIQWYNKQKKL